MKFGLRRLIVVCLLGLSNIVVAMNLSPDQMQMLKNLPADQQAALARQYGVDISQFSSGGASQNQANQVVTPQLPQKRDLQAEQQALADKNSAGETKELQRFGLDVFATQPTTFAPLNNIPVTDNYRLGPGDSLNVQLFGKENSTFEFRVNRHGSISFPELGPVYVAGLTFDEVKELLSQQVKEKKIGVRSNITMGELRTVEVFVLGDAYQPGKYLVSSLSTITHALYASGGINQQGSLRDIRLLRDGQLISRFDVYDLLIKGDTSNDLQLRNGDVIFVGPLGDTVSVEGEVVRPAIYELSGSENVDGLIKLAGGYTTKAYKKSARFERITHEGLIDLVTLDLNAKADLSKNLQNGDFLTVEQVAKRTQNYVSIKGNVARDGRYQWRKGQRIADLFPSIHRSLNNSSDLNYSLIIRKADDRTISVLQVNLEQAITEKHSIDNILLKPEDEILVFTKYDLELFSEAFQIGAKEKDLLSADAASFNAKMENAEQVANQTVGGQAVGFVPNQSIAQNQNVQLQQHNQQQNSTQQVPGEQSSSVQGMQSRSNQPKVETEIERIARITDTTVEEIEKVLNSTREKLLAPVLIMLQEQSSANRELNVVEVFGEVKFPGIYPITNKNTLKDLIEAAGGLKNGAYALHSELTRTIVHDANADVTLLRLDLNDVLQNNPEQNLVLQARDRLNVLAIPNLRKQRTISLQGEVRFPGTYVIKRGETLGDLVERAGGLTEYAHQDGAVFTREALRVREQKQLDSYAEGIRQEVAKKSLRQSGPGSFTSSSSPAEQLELIQEMSGTQALGRMVVDLPAILLSDSSKDFMLEDQDLLYVPQYRNTVTIMGEVQISTSYLLNDEYNFKDYINFAGGAKKQADEDRVFVVRANGSVYKPESGFWFKNNKQPLEPGDTIVVPIDTDYRDALSTWTAATQILYQIGVAYNAINK
ncbi:OtnA protein [Agarivorans sp. Toyoura001]|uniref:SLBB domain-containing protein n=1 Tax=Agarivorans sp. Toyoura001 TaxID=2283141 RepID=UPI0010DAFEEB|nr:SLBB domain-containing protein [Agarivorans sp. Toyoura001]GDY24162.1 OtnA protein [Agarivorans sp. Toyoura001]